MTRISIHGKGQALDGDLTTTGAVCIASSTNYRGNNQRALRQGDTTTKCPVCNKPGVIVEGLPFFNIEGKPAVVAGAHAKFQKLPWYARLLPPDFQAMMVGNTAAAMALWTERVGQNRPWDHKKAIRQQLGGVWHKQGEADYFYDIWSNIHYGYLGRAGGLSESVLLDGAGLEQIASDTIRKVQDWDEQDGPRRYADIDGMRAWDDIADRVSISIGIKLYKQQPNGGITAKVLMDEVLALPLSSWGGSVRDHVCH